MCLKIDFTMRPVTEELSRGQWPEDLILKAMTKRATRDLYVFKRVFRLRGGDLLTPFRYGEVHLGVTYEAELQLTELFEISQIFEIGQGIHAYTRYDWLVHKVRSLPNADHLILLAVIPKGSEYVIGQQGDVVASQMRYIKPIFEAKASHIPSSKIEKWLINPAELRKLDLVPAFSKYIPESYARLQTKVALGP